MYAFNLFHSDLSALWFQLHVHSQDPQQLVRLMRRRKPGAHSISFVICLHAVASCPSSCLKSLSQQWLPLAALIEGDRHFLTLPAVYQDYQTREAEPVRLRQTAGVWDQMRSQAIRGLRSPSLRASSVAPLPGSCSTAEEPGTFRSAAVFNNF